MSYLFAGLSGAAFTVGIIRASVTEPGWALMFVLGAILAIAGAISKNGFER